jgi:hypothetical protein
MESIQYLVASYELEMFSFQIIPSSFILKIRHVFWHVHGLCEMKFCRPLFALALCDKTKTSFLTRGGFPACRQAGFASLPVLRVFASSGRRGFLSGKKMKRKEIETLNKCIDNYCRLLQ